MSLGFRRLLLTDRVYRERLIGGCRLDRLRRRFDLGLASERPTSLNFLTVLRINPIGLSFQQ